jgi:hypothetical protein
MLRARSWCRVLVLLFSHHVCAGAAADHKKAAAVVLISAKREQNISIFLRTMKRENDEIHDAIMEMDEEVLCLSLSFMHPHHAH